MRIKFSGFQPWRPQYGHVPFGGHRPDMPPALAEAVARQIVRQMEAADNPRIQARPFPSVTQLSPLAFSWEAQAARLPLILDIRAAQCILYP